MLNRGLRAIMRIINSGMRWICRPSLVIEFCMRAFVLSLGALGVIWSLADCGGSDQRARDRATRIVSEIQRADYEGNQAGMQKGYDELAPFVENVQLASRARYWRGFAMWRKAVNGFNDAVDPSELEQDLKEALDEFKDAQAKDPGFVDAKIGTILCLGYVAFMNRQDPSRAKEFIGQMLQVVKEVKAMAPENPRLLWVLGPILWNTPPERGGGQAKAIENYEKGLDVIRKTKSLAGQNLEPTWGEPELLINLAWSHLNRSTPDLSAAERNARA